jgi:hypothetical protein
MRNPPRPGKEEDKKGGQKRSAKELFPNHEHQNSLQLASGPPRRKPNRLRDEDSYREKTAGNETIPADLAPEEMEKSLAFCCYQCFCPKETLDKVPANDPFVQGSDDSLYHRRCCHGVFDQHIDGTWLSEFEEALDNTCLEENKVYEAITINYLDGWLKRFPSKLSALYNKDEEEGMIFLL